MRIGVYGGSFNPIHKGHIKIAKKAISFLKLDLLLFVPAYKNPDKINHNYVLGKNRIEMINLVLPKKSKVFLWELMRKKISYTYETINYLKIIYPFDKLFFIIGSDNLTNLNKWDYIDQIIKNCKIVCFKRTNLIDKTNVKKLKVKLISNTLFPESSTDFRNGVFDYLDSKVQRYIGLNLLYLYELMQNNLLKNSNLRLQFFQVVSHFKNVLKHHKVNFQFLNRNINHNRLVEQWNSIKPANYNISKNLIVKKPLIYIYQQYAIFQPEKLEVIPFIITIIFCGINDFCVKDLLNNLIFEKVFEWTKKYYLNKEIKSIFKSFLNPNSKNKFACLLKKWIIIVGKILNNNKLE